MRSKRLRNTTSPPSSPLIELPVTRNGRKRQRSQDGLDTMVESSSSSSNNNESQRSFNQLNMAGRHNIIEEEDVDEDNKSDNKERDRTDSKRYKLIFLQTNN